MEETQFWRTRSWVSSSPGLVAHCNAWEPCCSCQAQGGGCDGCIMAHRALLISWTSPGHRATGYGHWVPQRMHPHWGQPKPAEPGHAGGMKHFLSSLFDFINCCACDGFGTFLTHYRYKRLYLLSFVFTELRDLFRASKKTPLIQKAVATACQLAGKKGNLSWLCMEKTRTTKSQGEGALKRCFGAKWSCTWDMRALNYYISLQEPTEYNGRSPAPPEAASLISVMICMQSSVKHTASTSYFYPKSEKNS